MTVKKEATKKANASKKNVVNVEATKKDVEAKKAEIREVKQRSNTQRCADMIMQLAEAAKYTRQEIVTSVADAISALSIVTVKTMLSDLQNSKYAKRYSSHTIKIDRETKLVTIAEEIKA